MTKFIRIGTAYNLTGSRQFDFYVTDREILAQAKESVKQAYKRFESVSKGCD